MRFQVPQFIEVEDKIFGPLTLRQFIYLSGTAGIIVMLWAVLPTFLVFLIGAPIAALGGALSFIKINNRPFINILESAFSFTLKNNLYIWKKREHNLIRSASGKNKKDLNTLIVPTLSKSKLKDLAWSLDIKESIYSDKNQQQ